jgi:hypothetical protein
MKLRHALPTLFGLPTLVVIQVATGPKYSQLPYWFFMLSPLIILAGGVLTLVTTIVSLRTAPRPALATWLDVGWLGLCALIAAGTALLSLLTSAWR